MTHNKEYYCDLKNYKITWPKFKLGFQLSDIQRMVYNPCILAKQEIVDIGNDWIIVRITEAVKDVMAKVLEHYKSIEEVA